VDGQKRNKRVQFGYGLNYLIDIENAVIVDVEPTPCPTYDEVEGHEEDARIVPERRFDLKSRSGCAAIPGLRDCCFLGMAGRATGLRPHIPVRDASERDDGTFSRSDFSLGQKTGRLHLPE